MIYLVVANYIHHGFAEHSYVKSLNEFDSGIQGGYGDIKVLVAREFLYGNEMNDEWDVSEKCVIKSNLNYLTNR